jgi:hypothetical protein
MGMSMSMRRRSTARDIVARRVTVAMQRLRERPREGQR